MGEIRVGIIGGTGLGQVLGEQQQEARRHEVQTPFGSPSDAIVETSWHGLPVFLLSRHGPGHVLPPSRVPWRANIFALKSLGVTHILASGAVGSLRQHIRPRDLVICDQVIDKTQRCATFFDGAAVHVEMAEPFCPVLRGVLAEAAAGVAGEGGFTAHAEGCYVCMEGPAFSTRAESLMHRLWGGDVIGMTAMPEAKLAREAEIAYALVALATDYDCWKPHDPAGAADKQTLLKEILANLQAATANALAVLRRAVEILAAKGDALPPSPAHRALELAIWSDKNRIDPELVKLLGPLWVKYFG
jgi:5'-methylthioadenosine phosphorylase